MSVRFKISELPSSIFVVYFDSLPSRLSCVRRNLPYWWDSCLIASTDKQLCFQLPIALVNQHLRYGVSPFDFVWDSFVTAMSDYVTSCYMSAY